jgi:hypothetical protein
MKVFYLNDCDWYIAATLEEAKGQCAADTGLPVDEATEPDAHELTDEDLDRLIFMDEDEGKLTFRQELERQIATGNTKPRMFASTEY